MPLKSFRMAKLLVYSTHAHALASEVFLESRIALSSESKGVWNRVENLYTAYTAWGRDDLQGCGS
jgi:hypothetical protein